MSTNLFLRMIQKAVGAKTAQQPARRGERRSRQARRSRLFLERLEARELLSTTIYTVNTTADSGAGSLRQAILNSNVNPGSDIIQFNIPGPGVHTISPMSQLPDITDPVIIDGYTQHGASQNTNGPGLGDNAVLQIELDGTNAG